MGAGRLNWRDAWWPSAVRRKGADEGEPGSEMGETGRSVEGGTERMVETARCNSLLTRDGRRSWDGGGGGGGQGEEEDEAAGGLKGEKQGSGGREG